MPRLRPFVILGHAAALLATALIVPASAGVSARLREALEGIPVDRIPTGILADRSLEMVSMRPFDGSESAPPADLAAWTQIYHQAREARTDAAAWVASADLIAAARETSRRTGAIPLGVLDLRYDRLRADALARGVLVVDGDRLAPAPGAVAADLFDEDALVAIAPLIAATYRGESVRFRLDRAFMRSSGVAPVRSIVVDCGDGSGERSIEPGGEIVARYETTGEKRMRFRLERADGSRSFAGAVLRVEALRTPTPDMVLPITAAIPFQGVQGTGEAYVWLGQGHTQIREAAIVIEGFDFDNTMGMDALYALLNRENLLENLRAAGFDAVVLNFTNAVDYIQRNAFVAVELIQQVQTMVGPDRSIVVAGASMGGLVGRYALSYMETMGIPHRARTFLSFDSPQDGANIPLGIQYWIAFFADDAPEAAAFLAALDSPGARQMLAYHHTDPPTGIGQADPLRGSLVAELASIGDYPDAPRTVAVTNGSAHAWAQGYPAGAQLIQWEYSSWFVDVIGNVWAVPDGTSREIFHGLIDIIFLPADEQRVSVTGTAPYDNAPGGWRDSMADMDAVQAPYGDIIALQQNHCFIPAVSALAIETGDLFYDIEADPNILSRTPFDAVYFPSAPQNQEHVEINPENAVWLFDEITRGANAVPEPALGGIASVRSVGASPNPARDRARVEIEVPRPGAARLAIVDPAGRVVAVPLECDLSAGRHTVEIPLADAVGRPLASGAYYIDLSGRGFRASGKVLVR